MESEMLFLLVLALIVLGPRRLPEIGRQLGRALAELRRAKAEFTAQIEEEVRRLEVSERQKKLEQPGTAAKPMLSENPGTANQISPPVAPPAGTVSVAPAGEAQIVNTATAPSAE
ncbi:MAG TPA: twin-arginine translocase TatA/TatE family subunit [Terriglobales bacterium]|nr:twin-arginine translocase TatA/TatE family subunit [Terriglobales bacterium]